MRQSRSTARSYAIPSVLLECLSILAMAALVEQVKLGDTVIITNGQRINVGDAVSGV